MKFHRYFIKFKMYSKLIFIFQVNKQNKLKLFRKQTACGLIIRFLINYFCIHGNIHKKKRSIVSLPCQPEIYF